MSLTFIGYRVKYKSFCNKPQEEKKSISENTKSLYFTIEQILIVRWMIYVYCLYICCEKDGCLNKKKKSMNDILNI